MLILPVNSAADRRFQMLLGSELMTLRTYWNSVAPGWYLDLELSDGTSLARGLALVPGVNVLEAETELTRQYGQFRVIPFDGGENNTPTSLGDTAQVWWFAPGEWEALDDGVEANNDLSFNTRDLFSATPKYDTNQPIEDLQNFAFALAGVTQDIYYLINTEFYYRFVLARYEEWATPLSSSAIGIYNLININFHQRM